MKKLTTQTLTFVAVPTENKPSTPTKSFANPDKSDVDDLQKRVVTKLNSNNSGWTMPTDVSTYKVEVLVNDATIDLSDLLIAQPVHARTRMQIRVNKRFKFRKHGKKHAVKHLKQRKKALAKFNRN